MAGLDSGGHVTGMTDTNFRASTDQELANATVPNTVESIDALPGVTTTTMMVVGAVVTCCVVLALLAAAVLRHRKQRHKRLNAHSKEKPDGQTDKDIYAEIEATTCCCLCSKDSTRSPDHADNIYAEVSDIIPTTPSASKPPREVIYETLDGKDWSRFRSKSQGANDKPRCNMPPKIYDHLSFLELERLRKEAGEPVGERRGVSKSDPVQISAGYDHLDRSHSSHSQSDDPDGNNNSLIRRLSQKQILKKLHIVECNRPRRGPPLRHDYFEIEKPGFRCQDSGPKSSEIDMANSMNSHEYFSLEDVSEKVERRRRQKPPVPTRSCSLISSNERCVSYPCAAVKTSGDTGRRIRSYPEPNQDAGNALNCTGSISVISSVVSSEAVYNIKTGHAQRISSDGRGSGVQETIRAVRNDYFVLDPVFVSNETTMDSLTASDDNQLHGGQNTTEDSTECADKCPKQSGARHDYFVLEAEEKPRFHQKPRFRIVEERGSPSLSYRHFARQLSEPYKRSSGGVTVINLVQNQSSDPQEENIYDRIRFQSVSESKKSDYRPRLMSTPNNIDF